MVELQETVGNDDFSTNVSTYIITVYCVLVLYVQSTVQVERRYYHGKVKRGKCVRRSGRCVAAQQPRSGALKDTHLQ